MGEMDFRGMPDILRREIIKKGTVYMNAYMYAIREYEDAIDDCLAGCPGGPSDTVDGKECNGFSTNDVHSWDEGVAFYTGSLEGSAIGGNSAGKLSYRLAEKRCENFKTCGQNGNSTTGVSQVNTQLLRQLEIGRHKLLTGKCEDTRPIIRKIVALMSIPLIQGTLRYAYMVDKQSGGYREKGAGAIFSASIVPKVASCSSPDATIIMNHMKIGASRTAETSFADVKAAFERNYACMGITCAEVGGLWDFEKNEYYEGAAPCTDPAYAPETAQTEEPLEVSGCAPLPGVFTSASLIILLTTFSGAFC